MERTILLVDDEADILAVRHLPGMSCLKLSLKADISLRARHWL